jgi:predicted DNA binding CopG/RHH family protein
MKHVFNLTKEEKEMEKAVDRTNIHLISAAERARLQEIAKNTTAKNKTITIRVSERNLMHLKAAASREGVSYQTLVSALIQKHI